MAPFTIWEKNNNIKKAFKIMKAIDKVGNSPAFVPGGENGAVGSEMVFKWADKGAFVAEWGLLLLPG